MQGFSAFGLEGVVKEKRKKKTKKQQQQQRQQQKQKTGQQQQQQQPQYCHHVYSHLQTANFVQIIYMYR